MMLVLGAGKLSGCLWCSCSTSYVNFLKANNIPSMGLCFTCWRSICAFCINQYSPLVMQHLSGYSYNKLFSMLPADLKPQIALLSILLLALSIRACMW